MKRSLFAIIIIFSLVFSLAGSIRPVLANNPIPLLDVDQDGISTAMENAGWYNLTGGPYVTNPNEADTDQDGLTDAQEKLFNTNPTDPHNPGISVPYESSYKTFEYYSTSDPAYLSMIQGGNQYLLTEGAVIRRGTTFKINALNTGTAALTIMGDGLTVLTPVRDSARGGWTVTVPLNGTVGTYIATISDGTWSKSMPIYVIFELPTDMTQAQISAYLYDDDPANKRDEVAVWWRAIDWKYYNSDSVTPTPCLPTDLICSNDQYHTISGYAQAFWTEQFTKNVLLTYTLPVINGLTNQYQASSAIGDKADQSVRVNFASVKNSFSSATKIFYDPTGHPDAPYSMNGGGCETSAGVYTAMLRSVGIASRPVVMDYNKTIGHGESGNYGIYEYDTAVMMWAKSPLDTTNSWYVERTFNGAEPEYQTTPIWTSGALTPIRPLSTIGSAADPFKHFQDAFSDNIQSANENWDFQNGSLGGGMVNTAWTGIDVPDAEFVFQNRDFKWNSKYPLEIQQSPYVDIFDCQLWKGDNWAPSEWYASANPLYASNPPGRTARQTYNLPLGIPTLIGDIENWPYNPKPTSCSDSTSAAACAASQLSWQPVCPALPGQSGLSPQSAKLNQVQLNSSPANAGTIQLGSILSDAGLDLNGDGRFDQLNVKFQLTSSRAGQYQLGGWLQVGDKLIRANLSQVTLTQGLQTVQISFDGQQIGDNKINGPYQVVAIWAAPAKQAVSELALPAEMTAYQTFSYSSQSYQAAAFTVQAASITGAYSYAGSGTNAKGLFTSIMISVPLSTAIPGTYKVAGDLYDARDKYVGHAEWTGSGLAASLKYAIAGTQPPYSLAHLNLADAKGNELASFYAPVYKTDDLAGKVSQGSIGLQTTSASTESVQSVTPPTSFTATPVDTNADGLFDQLVVSAPVDVTGQGGAYWMEGLLVNDQNTPVAWSVSDPQTLSVGTNQTLQMTFDGRMLFDQLPQTGSQKFSLVAVKIFSGTPGQAFLEADVPVSGFATPAFSRSQFNASVPGYTLFQDDMESGPTNWILSNSSQWSLTNNFWHSFTNAWVANGSTSSDGLLSLASPLNLTDYASPWLWFNTAYQLADNQNATLEVSTNGTTWTPLKTYTGTTTYWSSQIVDLSAYAKTAGVRLRFNAQSSAGSTWAIDDVYIHAGPAIKSASFTYNTPAQARVSTTLTANYVSINKNLPVTFLWDFCGVTRQTSNPIMVYKFVSVGSCLVKLTVDNTFDSANAAPQTIAVAQPPANVPYTTYLPVLSTH